MRIVLLAGVALLAAASAHAAVITEIGTPIGPERSGENNASLTYQFAPISVPGTITAITATYVGSVLPGLYALGLNTVSSITLTPYAYIDNAPTPVAGIGYSSVFVLPPTPTASGAPQTFPAALFNANVVSGFIGSPITVSSSLPVVSDNITGLASGPVLLSVAGYAAITGETYIPGAIGSLQVLADRSTVNTGQLTLAITYEPPNSVPEPMSLALLGSGLLGLVGLRRR